LPTPTPAMSHADNREKSALDPGNPKAFMPGKTGADYCIFRPVHGAYQSSGLSHSGSPVNGAGREPSCAVCEPGVNAGPNTAAPKPRERGKTASRRGQRCVEQRGRSPGYSFHNTVVSPNGPVGVNRWTVDRHPGLRPWAVEYDPVGVGAGEAITVRSPHHPLPLHPSTSSLRD